MEKTVVKFRHCGKDIYSFSKLDVTLKQQNACSAERNVCPVCRNALVLGLLDAPVALPSPFTNGHETQCSFLLGANEGPWYLGEWRETELHVGLSDSKGLVYNYTLAGVQRDEHGWEQCVSIQLVPPYRQDLTQLWDKELNLFSSLPVWTPERCCSKKINQHLLTNQNRALNNTVIPRGEGVWLVLLWLRPDIH
ncbi:MKRN2 opposite strand, tandem duplicate 1 isoform X2 [Ictalurus punctatus]|uniref:MKRN2 opposite strand, tandem duplicate 1 isoform X2 n=1 Tax=Ictalurus punctatus TaxID=7998 RepID=A0A979EM77_ICTPU|nr:MKRN2 opposite strand, tandem duplicate 1 isoform X2 [Ictalurus punctatus]